MKKLFFLFTITIFFACGNNHTVSDVKQDEIIVDTAPIEIVEEPIYIPDSLDFYFLKKNISGMHSGGNIRLANKYFHQIYDSTYIYYDYWAIEFHMEFETESKPLCFKALKPWTSSEDRYYDNDNEILVGIKSCLAWDGLQQSNFVNQPILLIELRFGVPDTIVSDCYIYYRGEKLLTLKIVENKVNWFKYFWLNYSFQENQEMLKEFINW